MTQLRRLDASVTQKATTVSLVLGIIGALILGTGMSFAMTDIGMMIGLSEWVAILIGIVIGIVGVVLVCAAYPIYNRIVKKEQEKIAPEIIRLTDELIKLETSMDLKNNKLHQEFLKKSPRSFPRGEA